ncbi:enoyl-CoA hydratase/isomerase family protein [Hydrogenophaga sp.]|uniref:enoyl-CoA hydratase/isomerase family protein n=1 Tax=Hydrogenophaga sp. TaxID=1904254 RepID=UPI003F6FF65B
MKTLSYQTTGSVASIVLTREASRNALDELLIMEMGEALHTAGSDGSRVLVITGTGTAFCAGADLKMVSSLMEIGPTAVTERFLVPLQTMLTSLRNLRLPVIAAVNGACFAGGLEMVLCCDLILAADTARFSDAHARHGLLPAAGGVHGLLRSVGSFKAREMLFTGDEYSAQDMLIAGIVSRVVPASKLNGQAQELAQRLCERSPAGLACMKKMVAIEENLEWAAAARCELEITSARLHGKDPVEGLRAFQERRKPVFTDPA